MIKTEELKQIITDNKDTIAFIIGNGIHNYLHNKHQNNYPCKTWDKLLVDLWLKFTKQPLPYFLENKDENVISNTEFFNLLEIEYLSKIHMEKNDYQQQLKELASINQPEYNHIEINNILKNVPRFFEHNKIDLLKQYQENYYKYNEFHKNSDDFFNNLSEEYDVKYDALRDKLDAIVYTTYAISDRMMFYLFSEPIKKQIAKSVKAYNFLPEVSKIVNKIKSIEAPILTTNYDTVLSESLGIDCDNIKSFESVDKIKENWFSYYGDDIDNPISGFGIWHIHGVHTHYKSISIGITDYMKNVFMANCLLPDSKILVHELHNYNWVGYNSWLNIFFNKDLFVFGLGLNNDESFLRWLFIKRKEYSILSRKNLKSWYIINHGEKISYSKKYFLESVGFKIVNIQDWDVLYEKIWE